MSVADMAVVTVQDLLKQGSTARMNIPGTSAGNWQWRYRPGALNADTIRWLGELTETFGRAPKTPEPAAGAERAASAELAATGLSSAE